MFSNPKISFFPIFRKVKKSEFPIIYAENWLKTIKPEGKKAWRGG